MDVTPLLLQVATTASLVALAVSRSEKGEGGNDQDLCLAAASGDLQKVEKLLAAGVKPDSLDPDGATALVCAIQAAEVEVVRTLLAAGADPDFQDDSGLTPLMHAIIADGEMDLDGAHRLFLEIIEQLLAVGADVELEDQDGATALTHASDYDLQAVLELLGGD